MKTPFNINDFVFVKLNDFGRKIHESRHDDIFENYKKKPTYHPPHEDSEGWSKWQMWDLFHNFGEYCFIGREMPFATDIQIEFQNKPTAWGFGSIETNTVCENNGFGTVVCRPNNDGNYEFTKEGMIKIMERMK